MTTAKEFIKNRKGQKLAVVVERQEDQKGLAFVMHGLGGFKEQPHIRAFAEAFLENGFTVVTFDAANTIGESEGKMEDVTVTNSLQDLEDVIKWAQSQEWREEPFVLAGHSLGGMCTTLYAEKYSQQVKGLAPISTVVSGELTNAVLYIPEYLEEWKRQGYILQESVSRPGVMKKINYSFIEDNQRYNVLSEAGKLTMPVLLIVGEQDTGTPLEHQQLLYEKLPGKKEIHIIKDADHNFRNNGELNRTALKEVKQIFDKWIKSL